MENKLKKWFNSINIPKPLKQYEDVNSLIRFAEYWHDKDRKIESKILLIAKDYINGMIE